MAHGKKFLVSDKICIADFYVGGLILNNFMNPNHGLVKKYEGFLDNYPKLKAYGERLAAENSGWLAKRGKYPM